MTKRQKAAKAGAKLITSARKSAGDASEGAKLHAAVQKALHGRPPPSAGSIKFTGREGDRLGAKKKASPRKATTQSKTVNTKFSRGGVAKMMADVLARPATDLDWLVSRSQQCMESGPPTTTSLFEAGAGRMVLAARRDAEKRRIADRSPGAWSAADELLTLLDAMRTLSAKYERAVRHIAGAVKRGRPPSKAKEAAPALEAPAMAERLWSGLSTQALDAVVTSLMSKNSVSTVRAACRVIAEGALEEDNLLPISLTKRASAVNEAAIRLEKRVSAHRSKERKRTSTT